MNATLSPREKETRTRKDALRIAMRRTRRMLSQAHRGGASRRACTHLMAMPVMRSAGTVAVYSAIRREADPAMAVETLWQTRKTVVFPRVIEGRPALRFSTVAERAELVPGSFGVACPAADRPEVPLRAIEVFVVPGLAFDPRGYRLGWGRGYYDATLACSRGVRIGFAFHNQLVTRVPESDHDQPMDYLVTDAGVVAFAQQPPNQAPPSSGLQDKE